MPVFIFDIRSNLERYAYAFGFAPIFLEKAAACKDPLEQMKCASAFCHTLNYLYLKILKPFNP